MRAQIDHVRQVVMPRLWENRLLALAALVALAVSLGLWFWSGATGNRRLRVAAGIELKYRKELVTALAEESQNRDLKLEIDTNCRAADSIARVARGEFDAAVIPAGMAAQEDNIRQVALFDCEPLQLFVRPEIFVAGLPALKGKRLSLGSPGSGVRVLATDVLNFIGMKAGVDYQDEVYPFSELIQLPPARMPDGVFSLAPLPSPLGERLVQQYGYHLLELPFGAALAMRKATIEETSVPANTYSAQPAVPAKTLATVGTRAILIAHCNVPKATIGRLLEVLYESDFAHRARMPLLSENALLRASEYPAHPGTLAFIHRHDPWVNKDFVDNITSLRGLFVSLVSTALLVWQWYRRSRVGAASDYLRVCTSLEIEALHAAEQGPLAATQVQAYQARLTDLRLEALEKHQAGVLPGDQQFTLLLTRIDGLRQSLPRLSSTGDDASPHAIAIAEPLRRAA